MAQQNRLRIAHPISTPPLLLPPTVRGRRRPSHRQSQQHHQRRPQSKCRRSVCPNQSPILNRIISSNSIVRHLMQERKASRAKLRVNASAAANGGRNAGPANANCVDHVPKARVNKVARQRAKAVKAIKAVKQLREVKVATAIMSGIKNAIRSAMTEVIVTVIVTVIVIAKESQRNPSAHLNQQTVF